jgi:hypothetical protein
MMYNPFGSRQFAGTVTPGTPTAPFELGEPPVRYPRRPRFALQSRQLDRLASSVQLGWAFGALELRAAALADSILDY